MSPSAEVVLLVSVRTSFALGVRYRRNAQSARRGKERCLLLPLLVVVPISAYSGDRSGKFARTRKKDGVTKGVGQDRDVRLVQRKGAGRILETAGSTSDLKSQSTVGLLGREIDAIGSLREIDLQ